ncbi:S-adenosyl-L-methionine-dependent methyltransferase [Rickenella mellea]|uniref:DNA (cytosine-5-)-methyltransferase n=1 Tax=Rickenella mellea TaxID=50990 RepID=A0A4Y7PWG3_9AGAM|nr:S-adenosyl-L-methionine-dependent methyltransferase [Rickenella mellea]
MSGSAERTKRKRPDAASFWSYPVDYTGPRDDGSQTENGQVTSPSSGPSQHSFVAGAPIQPRTSIASSSPLNPRAVSQDGSRLVRTQNQELPPGFVDLIAATRTRSDNDSDGHTSQTAIRGKRKGIDAHSNRATLRRSAALLPPSLSSHRSIPRMILDSDSDSDTNTATPRLYQNRSLPVSRYVPSPGEVRESAALIVVGEDSESSAYSDDTHKPIRALDKFVVFDSENDLRLVDLRNWHIHEELTGTRLEAAGEVAPVFVDEDAAAGFEEMLEEQGEDALQRIRLSMIIRLTIDYTKERDPIYIETEHAWYILKTPSPRYHKYYVDFYKTHKISQCVISAALDDGNQSLRAFKDTLLSYHDSIVAKFTEQDLKLAHLGIKNAVDGLENAEQVAAKRLIRELLPNHRPIISQNRRIRRHPALTLRNRTGAFKIQNIDRWVLLYENQNPTCVTPSIANLAAPYFQGLVVVGHPLPTTIADGVSERSVFTALHARAFLQHLLDKARGPPANVRFPDKTDVIRKSDRRNLYTFFRSVIIDGERCQVGDVLIIPAGFDHRKPAPMLPLKVEDTPNAWVGDYFWFGKIISIRSDDCSAHVQWFQHGKMTMLEELAHPQELFITDICQDVKLSTVVGKAKVVKYLPGIRPPRLVHDTFFYSLSYHQADGSFQGDLENTSQQEMPPNNCKFCSLSQERINDETSKRLTDDKGVGIGFVLRGTEYHCTDVVMLKSESGPCDIARIESIAERVGLRGDPFRCEVRHFGRMSELGNGREDGAVNAFEDRHLCLTNKRQYVNSQDILGACYVLRKVIITNLEEWLALSPLHFYVTYELLRGRVIDTVRRQDLLPISRDNFPICGYCFPERMKEVDGMRTFEAEVASLRMFDPFGGVGALGMGMEKAGCLKATHATEISPSTAKTLKANNPETVIYNQCANKLLEHAIKLSVGLQSQLWSIGNENELLPLPPKPEDIDCIIAGFPCQPHSTLNMFQRADDIKSSLILNVLAWVDYLKPKFCVFENVRGFLSYNLNAVQAGPHKLIGGIPMGGLKFLVRVLVTLGYQVRFSLLQAGHYGTPQSRVRFFLFASQHNIPLPSFPSPTHNFPKPDALEIRFPNGDNIGPIDTRVGTAPNEFISIGDAISDLRRWDWKNPHRIYKKSQEPFDCIGNKVTVDCSQEFSWCGPRGNNPYEHPPRTIFQLHARQGEVKDLQHYTRCLKPEIVERVANIPMVANADYRSLRPKLWEWQATNPSSSIARRGYPAGLYGRLDEHSYFPTTVTNVEPAAKQSRVLNPWCKRTVTVRELARSQGFPDNFQFHAINDDVKTMHRQIGNAVPLPMGHALGRELRAAMFKKWKSEQQPEQMDIEN